MVEKAVSASQDRETLVSMKTDTCIELTGQYVTADLCKNHDVKNGHQTWQTFFYLKLIMLGVRKNRNRIVTNTYRPNTRDVNSQNKKMAQAMQCNLLLKYLLLVATVKE